MSYRCGICNKPSRPKVARRVHIIYRDEPTGEKATRRTILREIPVCHTCSEQLDSGMPLKILQRFHAPEPPITLAPAQPQQVVPPLPRGPVSLRGPVALRAGDPR